MLDPLTPTTDEIPGGDAVLTRIPEHLSPAGGIMGVNGSSMLGLIVHKNSLGLVKK
jgi:hypothetical protein